MVSGDEAHAGAVQKAAFSGPDKILGVMRKARKRGVVDPLDAALNRVIAKVRAPVEHPYRVLKRKFGYLKTRYRGLAKNRTQLITSFAVDKLFLVRRQLQT